MRKLLLLVLALALAVTVAGLTTVHASGHNNEHGQKVKRSPSRTVTRQRLSQQQILAIGCGPLTQQAAQDVLHGQWRCGR
jgi:hypothetical protein